MVSLQRFCIGCAVRTVEFFSGSVTEWCGSNSLPHRGFSYAKNMSASGRRELLKGGFQLIFRVNSASHQRLDRCLTIRWSGPPLAAAATKKPAREEWASSFIMEAEPLTCACGPSTGSSQPLGSRFRPSSSGLSLYGCGHTELAFQARQSIQRFKPDALWRMLFMVREFSI